MCGRFFFGFISVKCPCERSEIRTSGDCRGTLTSASSSCYWVTKHADYGRLLAVFGLGLENFSSFSKLSGQIYPVTEGAFSGLVTTAKLRSRCRGFGANIEEYFVFLADFGGILFEKLLRAGAVAGGDG